MDFQERKDDALGTQGNLYSIGSRWGFAFGVMHILCFTLGVTQILAFLDTNMLVHQKQNCGVGGLSQHEDTTRMVFCRSGIQA